MYLVMSMKFWFRVGLPGTGTDLPSRGWPAGLFCPGKASRDLLRGRTQKARWCLSFLPSPEAEAPDAAAVKVDPRSGLLSLDGPELPSRFSQLVTPLVEVLSLRGVIVEKRVVPHTSLSARRGGP
jgi:hypothetical protein